MDGCIPAVAYMAEGKVLLDDSARLLILSTITHMTTQAHLDSQPTGLRISIDSTSSHVFEGV